LKLIRVRIKKKTSNYFNQLGNIILSNCDGTFGVQVWAEGDPKINLDPKDVEPC